MKTRIYYFVILITFIAALTHVRGSAYLNGYQSISVRDYNPINPQSDSSAYMIDDETISLEAWIYPIGLPAVGEKNMIIGRTAYYQFSASTNIYAAYELCIDNTGQTDNPVLAFTILTGTEANDLRTILSSVQITKETWTHTAATYDGSNMRLYINGQLAGTVPMTGNIEASGEGFNIGHHYRYAGFYGLINDVRLWETTRSQSQISTNMKTQLTGNESGLVGYWQLDTSYDYITPDLTPYHNDLHAYNYFSSASSTNMGGSTAHISIDTSPIDFGKVERGTSSRLDSIDIQNSGDKHLYGEIRSSEELVELSVYQSRYFVDPGDTWRQYVSVFPRLKGQFSGNIIFDAGNADNLGVQKPFSGEAVREEGFDANNIDMWVNSNGVFAYNRYYSDAGFEWQKYSGKTVVYSSGVWVGAKVNGQVSTAISARSSGITEFAPGPIIDGAPADPNDPEYQVYKIQIGDNAQNNPDYANWPAHLGAPIHTYNGNPKHLGDQTLFMVYNDLDPANHGRLNSTPLGAEIQQTVFGWDEVGDIGNTVFLRFKLINKSNNDWQDTYFALWSDPDVGEYLNDFVGVDTSLNMGYCYNAVPEDDIYGSTPPAVGYDILKGAFYSKPIQAFAYYDYRLPYPYEEPETGDECYNYLQGLLQNGQPHIDPNTSEPSTFPLNGDPVTGNGWTDSDTGDRRFLLSTGPFDLESGQGKEIVAAIVVAQGADYLGSVSELWNASGVVQQKYDEGDIFGGAIENVSVEEVEGGQTDTLNDIGNSGAQFEVTAGDSGATVEVATYLDAPPGTDQIGHSAIHGVGKYMDVQVDGEIEWPMIINMYYTQNDLDQAGITENELEGLYYWSVAREEWVLYYDSGDDDQGRGPSTTGVDTTNVVIEDTQYQGNVWANAYHLTPMRMGSALDSALIGLEDSQTKQALNYYLKQNYPNPFNPITTIEYQIPYNSRVTIEIYNLLGQKVAVLDAGEKSAGVHRLQWNASSQTSGVYFVRINCVSNNKNAVFNDIKKMILLK